MNKITGIWRNVRGYLAFIGFLTCVDKFVTEYKRQEEKAKTEKEKVTIL